MDTGSGHTTSLWMDTEMPQFPALERDAIADVCVVGAGIAGLTVAYTLAREGMKVIVLDQRHVGAGETLRTTAHLAPALDDRFYRLARLHGADGAREAAASHSAAVRYIEEICKQERINCDFEWLPGYLFAAPGSEDELAKELPAARDAGVEVERLDACPLPGPACACLRFARQAQFHPARYLRGLAEAVVRHRGLVYDDSPVIAIDERLRTVRTASARVSAQHVVVATNSPINDRVAMHTKQAPYRTYVIALKSPESLPTAGLYWDTATPYHYVRQARTARGQYLVVGGEDHKTGQAEDFPNRFHRLERWALEHFPGAGPVHYRWSGQCLEPVDALGFLGRNPGDRHVYIATGDSGNGMTHGTLAGMIIPDLIRGRVNPWAELYDPERKRLRAAGEFARENLNAAAHFGEYMTGGEVGSLAEVARGQGALVRHGALKVAAYRDEQGVLHARSAVCTHVGCLVHWNALELSWDCPCHGSRFSVDGEVLAGPAHDPLAVVEVETDRPPPGPRAPGAERRPRTPS